MGASCARSRPGSRSREGSSRHAREGREGKGKGGGGVGFVSLLVGLVAYCFCGLFGSFLYIGVNVGLCFVDGVGKVVVVGATAGGKLLDWSE